MKLSLLASSLLLLLSSGSTRIGLVTAHAPPAPPALDATVFQVASAPHGDNGPRCATTLRSLGAFSSSPRMAMGPGISGGSGCESAQNQFTLQTFHAPLGVKADGALYYRSKLVQLSLVPVLADLPVAGVSDWSIQVLTISDPESSAPNPTTIQQTFEIVQEDGQTMLRLVGSQMCVYSSNLLGMLILHPCNLVAKSGSRILNVQKGPAVDPPIRVDPPPVIPPPPVVTPGESFVGQKFQIAQKEQVNCARYMRQRSDSLASMGPRYSSTSPSYVSSCKDSWNEFTLFPIGNNLKGGLLMYRNKFVQVVPSMHGKSNVLAIHLQQDGDAVRLDQNRFELITLVSSSKLVLRKVDTDRCVYSDKKNRVLRLVQCKLMSSAKTAVLMRGTVTAHTGAQSHHTGAQSQQQSAQQPSAAQPLANAQPLAIPLGEPRVLAEPSASTTATNGVQFSFDNTQPLGNLQPPNPIDFFGDSLFGGVDGSSLLPSVDSDDIQDLFGDNVDPNPADMTVAPAPIPPSNEQAFGDFS